LPFEGPLLLLFALVITWVGDTAAYFVGRSIGRHALAPHLSPKKTWEGTAASFLGALIVAARFRCVGSTLPGHTFWDGCSGKRGGAGRRSLGIGLQAERRGLLRIPEACYPAMAEFLTESTR